MSRTNLSSLLAVVLVIIVCSLLASSFTAPTANKSELEYSLLADSPFFPFGTPTPMPTATPQPTPTPMATPRPEPSAKPTITVDCITDASASNPKVEVTGALTYNKTGVYAQSIYVGYSADGGGTWENFSLAQTNADGGFGAVWTPNATGNYLICAQYLGNLSLHWMNATVDLATVDDSAGSQFSIVSNSTVSNVAYDVATQQLSFKTNGTSDTTGYANVCIPKTLASDFQTLEVKMDGKALAFGGQSEDDVWVISCVYTQSQHAFTVQVPFKQFLSPAETPWLTIVIALVVLIAVVAAVLAVRRRRRTAATVASILKENRPTY